MLNNLFFAKPAWLYLIFFLIAGIFIYFRFVYKKETLFYFSDIRFMAGIHTSIKRKFAIIPSILRILLLFILILALMQPRMGIEQKKINKYGIDIVMMLDISGSMKASDFKPDRITVAKETAKKFISMRKNDRIGLVIFARNAFTQSPLTFDYSILMQMINEVHIGMIQDGTAIGDALVAAINLLKNSKSKSKVIILLTDGENNSGTVDPVTASKFASELGIKIYTIGIGNPQGARVPFYVPGYGVRYFVTKMNAAALKQIAQNTGGKYFNAKNNAELRKVYREINELEKTKLSVSVFHNYKERFIYLLQIALAVFLLELFLKTFILDRVL